MAEYESDDKDKEHPLHTEIRRWKKAREDYFDVAKRAEGLYSVDHKSGEIFPGARLNIFWSIVNTLKPALYAQPPKPIVARRYQTRDATAHIAAQVLERCTTFQLEASGFDAAVTRAIDDYLIAGQGTVWLRYEPVIGMEKSRIPVQELPQMQEQMDPTQPLPPMPPVYVTLDGQQVDSQAVKQDQEGLYVDGPDEEVLLDERVIVSYKHWSDILFEPARTWEEVRKIALKTHVTKKEFKQKFGEEALANYGMWKQEKGESETEREVNRGRICVYEVWDRDEEKVTWLADGYNEVLKESEPYLKFDGFFPCPKPLWATLSSTGLIPRPDICFYQDQQETLNQLCTKTQDIARYLKVLSIGDAAEPALATMLSSPNGSHIAITNYGRYAQTGGIKSAYEVLSMNEHAAILQVLHNAIEQEKNQIYDITGIADIVRGVSSASETLGAQQLKSQYAQNRIASRQREVAKFCREVVSLIAQVIKNHFQPSTILRMSGTKGEPEVEEFIVSAIDLLRKDADSDFKIEIEVDSTKFADIESAKQSAIELTNSLGALFNALLPHTQTIPQLVPVISELTLFTTRQFEAGREVYGKLENALTEMLATVEENRKREIEAQQREQQQAQMEAEAKASSAEGGEDAEVIAQAEEANRQSEMIAEQMKAQMQRQKDEAELALKMAKIKADEALERQKILLQDERERKAEELRHGREMLKFTIGNAQKLDLMAPRQRTRRGRIGTDETGQKIVIVEDIEDVAPEVQEVFKGIKGLSGNNR
ncbi:MAG: hypothetical protein ACO3S8_00760 [Aquiluna sp.]